MRQIKLQPRPMGYAMVDRRGRELAHCPLTLYHSVAGDGILPGQTAFKADDAYLKTDFRAGVGALELPLRYD
jgi:hypothetical protein